MSSMADFASAIGGGDPSATAPPPDPTATPDANTSQYATSLEALQGAEDALHSFIQLDPDAADRAQASKALALVVSLQANQQKSNQSGDMMSLARALGPGGASAGPPSGGAGGGY